MKRILKTTAVVLLVVGMGAAVGTTPEETSAAYDAPRVSKALATFKLGTPNSSPAVQHGTHLCSAHSHCGSGHLCCSGHCKAVQTCG